MFVSGAGGTGKSFLISAIRELICRLTLIPIPSIVTAPTGVAAFNINGTTIHRALQLPIENEKTKKTKTPYTPLKGENLHNLRIKWKDISTLIIDEISMISYQTLEHIHLRLSEIKIMTDPSMYFGGVNIIAVGDLYQLPPVQGSSIYSPNIATAFGKHLWIDHFRLIELKQVERQKGDQQFIDLLSRV